MDLFQNSFHTLAATPRDSRQRVVELADERSLSIDAAACARARSELTNPRKRLAAEIAWLPGVGPKRTAEIISLLEANPSDILQQSDLPPLAYANAIATGMLRIPPLSPRELSAWIIQLAVTFDAIDIHSVAQTINEERVVSGFTEVSGESAIEEGLQSRRYEYRKAIRAALERQPFEQIVETVTITVEDVTDIGEKHAPVLVDDLVDAYEVDVQTILGEKEANITTLLEQLESEVDAGTADTGLATLADKLIHTVKDWDLVAQPIQVSTKSRGLGHADSVRVAGKIREVAIYLWNQHGKLELAQRLTDMLQEVFAEVITVAERTAEDGSILDDLAERKKLAVLLAPIDALRNAIFEKTKKHPEDIGRAAEELIRLAPTLFEKLYSVDAPDEIVREEQESIAMLLIYCSIEYGNKTGKWEECIKILEEADTYTHDKATEQRIAENIRIARGNMLQDKQNKSKTLKKWIWIGIIAIAIIWYAMNSGTKKRYSSSSSSQYSQQNSLTARTPSHTSAPQYDKPTAGSGNVLSVSQIMWCTREQVRLETMRPRTQSNGAVNHFNSLVNDYNMRCSNFRYQRGDLERAQRDVAQDRAQIVNDAIVEISLY